MAAGTAGLCVQVCSLPVQGAVQRLDLGGNPQHPCAGASLGCAQHSFGGEGESSPMHQHEEGVHLESQKSAVTRGSWWVPPSSAASVISQVSQLVRLESRVWM